MGSTRHLSSDTAELLYELLRDSEFFLRANVYPQVG